MINIGDKLVEALVLDENGNKSTISFKVSTIDFLRSLEEKSSAIALRGGVIIPVSLGYDELKERIYSLDFKQGQEIDLKEVTGTVAKIISLPKNIKNNFNKHKGLTIKAILRKEYESKLKEFSFHESDISSFSSVSSMAKGGKSVQIEFNESAKKPFDSSRAIIDMPYDDFLKLKVSADNDLSEKLNLVEVFAANPKKYGIK